jgi:CRP-like cAMP-binding protein
MSSNANQKKLRDQIEEIVPLTNEEFSFILSLFTTKKFKKKQFLFQEGENVKYAYFIVSGLLKLTFTTDAGREHIVSFAMEDWWESDFPAYFAQTKATMSLQCLEDTTVFCLSLENYRKMCLDIQKMESFFLNKSNSGFIGSQRRILSLLTSNTKERYEQLLKQYPALFQRVSKTMLASYLGVSRETLSRLNSY